MDSGHLLVAAKMRNGKVHREQCPLVRRKSWTSKNCNRNERLSHSTLNSQTSFVNPNILPLTLVDYGPTFATPYVLRRFRAPTETKPVAWWGVSQGLCGQEGRLQTYASVCSNARNYGGLPAEETGKKREQERREREEIEMYSSKNDAKKSFKNVRLLKCPWICPVLNKGDPTICAMFVTLPSDAERLLEVYGHFG